MRRVNRRFWSLLLCVALALALLPTAVFMADPMDDPLLEGWTKIGGGYTGDLSTSVVMPYDVAVNDKQIVENPDVYTLMNGFSTHLVMKGTYSAAQGKYLYSPVSGAQPFTSDNMPVNLAFVGSYDGSYTLYVGTNNMLTSQKIWKYDGTTWTDITYGLGINWPSLTAYSNNVFAVGTTGVRTLYFLWGGATAWESVNLAPYITADLAAVVPASGSWGVFYVLDKTGKIWKVTVGRESSPYRTTLNSCTLVVTAPSGGGSDITLIARDGMDVKNDFYVTDTAAKCLQVFQSDTGSWVVLKNGAPNAFNGPMGIAMDALEQIYLSDPHYTTANSNAIYRQHKVPRLVWATQPGNGVTGGTLSTQPALSLVYRDQLLAQDVVATGNSANKVTVTLTSGTGTLLGTNEVTLNSGVATFAGLGVTGPGTYTLTASCGGLGSVSSSFTIAAATYGINLDKSGTQTFTGQAENYSAVSPLTVGVSNAGNQPTGALTVALSGANPGSFALSETAIGSIAVSGNDNFTVGPNADLAAGTYTATVTVSGGSVTSKSFDVSFTVAAATYGIDLDKSGTQTFTGETENYSAVSPLTVGIDNIGNQPTGALTVALSGANAGSFALSETAIDSIAVSGDDSFTVGPNTGLTAGTYTATVTVSGGSVTSKSFDISFTVNTPPTYAVTVQNDGHGTGSADYATAAQGVTVTLSSSANAGYHFKEWQVISPAGLTLTGNTFTMPAEAVTVKAVFEADPYTGTLYFVVGADENQFYYGDPGSGGVLATDLAGWSFDSGVLTLDGFAWETPAATALHITGGDLTIRLADDSDNEIISTYDALKKVNTFGISMPSGNLTIEGDTGSLAVAGGGTEKGDSAGIYLENGALTINGGHVSASGNAFSATGTSRFCYGISAGAVTINGGTVDATAADGKTSSFGIFSFSGVTVAGGDLHAVAGQGNGGAAISIENPAGISAGIAIAVGNVIISGGTVAAQSGAATNVSAGIAAYFGNVNISGGTVAATAGRAANPAGASNPDGLSAGIVAIGVTVSGGTVTATAGEAPDAFGVSGGITANADITISGGTVTATGDREALFSFVDSVSVAAGSYQYWTNTAASESGATGPTHGSATPFDNLNRYKYVKIAPAAPLAPIITTTALGGGTVDAPYSETLAVTGTAPIIWSMAGGSDPLPAGLALSEGGVISGTPTTPGTSIFTVKATNAGGSDEQELSLTVSPTPTYGIDLDKSGTQTFAGQTVGYGAVTPLTVGIDNIGNQPTGALTVALSGANADSFALSKIAIDNIAVSGDDSFTVGPNTGLAAGTYTATVTVSGGSVTSESFHVSLTVSAAPTHTVTASAGAGGAISPSGAVSVTEGDDAAFAITPDAGYSVASVIVDSVDQGAVSAYTFVDVRGDHTIEVTFRYTGGGSSDPYIPRTLIDNPTGVTASGNSVHALAQLTVSPLDLHATCAACDVIRQAQGDGQISLGYNISLTQGFIGALTVTIPVDSRYNGRTITILHCANGRLESLTATVIGGMATFTVSELSPFAVTGLTYSPKTGDAAAPAGFIALGLSALCAGWLIARRRRRA